MFINAEKRLKCEDHIVLYYYVKMKETGCLPDGVDETDFLKNINITEKLIGEYNNENETLKTVIYQKIANDKSKLAIFRNNYRNKTWLYEKAVIWRDREHTDYFNEQLIKSHQFEVFIESEFLKYGFDIGFCYSKQEQYTSETKSGVEIKNDRKMKVTGNLYIEYQERMKNTERFVNSGILKDDNTKVFVYGTMEKYVIIPKSILLDYYNRINKGEKIKGVRFVREKQQGTSRGFIIPIKTLEKHFLNIEETIRLLTTN